MTGEDESEKWDNEETWSRQVFLDTVCSSNRDLLLSKAARSTFALRTTTTTIKLSLAAECLGHREGAQMSHAAATGCKAALLRLERGVRIHKCLLPGLGNFYSTGAVLLPGSGTVPTSVLIL